MIAVALLAMFGGLTFVEQELPGMSPPDDVGAGPFFHCVDVDGDRVSDLVLPDRILLQRDGRFLTESPLPVPDCGGLCPAYDVWSGDFYLLSRRLTVVHWSAKGWETLLDQELDLPAGVISAKAAEPVGASSPPPRRISYMPFLHDLDVDGVPEIVCPSESGVEVFARRGAAYRQVATLKVFPPLQYGAIPRQSLWPPESRRIAFPPRQMTCRYVVEGAQITVIAPEDAPEKRVRYRVTRYPLDPQHDFALESEKASQVVTEPMARYMQPIALRPGGAVDFAGGDWEYSDTSILPQPIFVTQATTDNGAHIQSVRAPFFRSRCSFIDMNGDGRLDMVAEASDLFQGGVRECIERFTAATTIGHELRVYLQDEHGVFVSTPSWTAHFQIGLSTAPIQNDERFRWYQSGVLLDASGDFNRDGYRDVVVCDQMNRLAIYLNSGGPRGAAAGGLKSSPDLTIPLEPGQRSEILDLDGDGRSDILLQWRDASSASSRVRSRVYLTREGGE